MPIFHDPNTPPRPSPKGPLQSLQLPRTFEDTLHSQNAITNKETGLSRRSSDESIRTEFLEGPIEGPLPERELSTSPEHMALAAMTDERLGISDRGELIERIKRGESPTWVPNRNVSMVLSF
jgi:hypothetical protein